METAASNPLSRFAFQFPPATSRGASIAGRLFGAGLALAIAFEQSYDPTQAFTTAVALLVIATLLPTRGALGDWLAAVGAGLLFFAGTVFTHLGPGIGLMAMGAIAGAGSFALAHREGRDVTLPAVAFVSAVLVVALLQVVVVFAFES